MSKYEDAFKPSIILTAEMFAELKSKTYASGREIKIGDTILFGLLFLEEYHYKLIMYCKEEVNITYQELPIKNCFPVFKLII